MALVLHKKYIGPNNSYKLFLSNRILRLLPVYWAVLFATILLGVFSYIFLDNGLSIGIYIKYFPDAIVEVTKLSVKGSQQHHGDKVWWDKSKSSDELDALMRHLIEGDWAAVAWRAMANLQRECDDKKSNI